MRVRWGNKSRVSTLRAAGNAARDRGDWEEAANIYSQIVAIDPSQRAVSIQLGNARQCPEGTR